MPMITDKDYKPLPLPDATWGCGCKRRSGVVESCGGFCPGSRREIRSKALRWLFGSLCRAVLVGVALALVTGLAGLLAKVAGTEL